MRDHKRRAVAFVAGTMLAQLSSKDIYDIGSSRRISFSGKISEEGIFLFDIESKCRVIGRKHASGVALLYGTDEIHLTFGDDPKQFRGIDAESKAEFFGTISGKCISMHDEESKQDFVYEM